MVIWNPATFLLVMSSITVILLLATLSVFVLVAARSKDIRGIHFQISIFIIIWVSGQVVDILQESGIIMLSPLHFRNKREKNNRRYTIMINQQNIPCSAGERL